MELTAEPEVKSKKEVKKYSILYVDDEKSNLRVFKSLFKKLFNVYTTEHVWEAFEILKDNPIQLVITDQRMPEMTGTEFLEKMIPDYPDMITIILTGFTDIEVIKRAVNKVGIYKYITKPWDFGEMKTTIDKAMESYQLKQDNLNLVGQLQDMNVGLESTVKERTKELSDLNDDLTKSINFVGKLQNSMLPKPEKLERKFDDHFVIYKPKGIVSQDFYWLGGIDLRGQQFTFLALLECKGEGLIGSIQSFIADSLVNEIVQARKIINADDILQFLFIELNEMFSSDDNTKLGGKVKASIVSIDHINEKLNFAGVGHDLLIYHEEDLFVVQGTDEDPSEKKGAIKKYSLKYTEPVQFYMFSKGFMKEPGEESDLLDVASFSELVTELADKPFDEQHIAIEQKITGSFKNNEQVDDYTVLGFKL
ncbi:MAG: response regulator [bacterium]|nr:response regulator [bacterium]